MCESLDKRRNQILITVMLSVMPPTPPVLTAEFNLLYLFYKFMSCVACKNSLDFSPVALYYI